MNVAVTWTGLFRAVGFGRRFARIPPVLMIAPFLVCPAVAQEMSEFVGEDDEGPRVRIVRVIQDKAVYRNYPYALPTLLDTINRETALRVDPQPLLITSFADPTIFKHPFVFVNFADRTDWTFSPLEKKNLKDYLERGGFVYIDAGINAEFLREEAASGQHHSFAEWDACPTIKQAFKTVFPDRDFQPLPRSHALWDVYYEGLPDASDLPDTVRDFVVNEKWPDGTFSAVALKIDGRIAVLATPIVSMGWGKNPLGNWGNRISFRVREGATGLSERLRTAAYSGARYETVREDGRKDIIYCQEKALPAWVHEPNGTWRVFRYYYTREISDYAHQFYTRLGVNIIMYALTH